MVRLSTGEVETVRPLQRLPRDAERLCNRVGLPLPDHCTSM